jgi:hypothetical protein
MYTRKLAPKLGALQRWVRECDATSAADGSPGDPEALRCLDMILRLANVEQDKVVRKRSIWGDKTSRIDIWAMMQRGELKKLPNPSFRPVHRTPGPLRRPPNLYDSTVYASEPNAIALSTARTAPSKHEVPGVPGAFLVKNVFTPDECLQIVQAAVGIGFELDEAAEGSARAKTSVSD